MKINNKKVLIPTLSIAMACALAGSIAGSVAWYQYSTRATSFLNGTSAGTSRNLQLATELVDDELTDNIDDAHWGYHYAPQSKEEFAPTAVVFNDDDVVESFVSHPVYQHFNNWVPASDDDHFSYDLYFQSLDKDKNREALDVYLTAVDLRVDDASGMIEKALRVELVPYTFDGTEWIKGEARILSKEGGKTITTDYLNLNKEDNNIMDHDGFAADDSDGVARKYKAGSSVKSKILEENESLAGYFLDQELTIPAHIHSVDVNEGEDIQDLEYYVNEALTEHANNFHEVEGFENGDGTGLFLDSALQNPAPNPLTADGIYFAAGAKEGKYFFNYNEVVAQRGDDAGEGDAVLYKDRALSIPAETYSDNSLVEDGTYYKKVLADGTSTYYAYQTLSDEYESEAYDDVVANDNNPYAFTNKTGNVLVQTSEEYAVKLTVNVWLEGWQEGDAAVTHLDEGTDGTGYFSDSALTNAAVNSHAVVAAEGDSEKDLFKDQELTIPAEGHYEKALNEGDDGTDFFTDEDCTIPATNYREFVCAEGDDGTDLFKDPECTQPAAVDADGKLAYDGTYYKFGVATGTYYAKGVAAGTYYAKGVETADYYSRGYIWDTNTIGSHFNLGLRFGVEASK